MKQALSGPDAERWKASMEKELTIEKMGVWRHPTFQRKNFRYHVRLSILKLSKDGCISEWKSCLCALGNLSKE